MQITITKNISELMKKLFLSMAIVAISCLGLTSCQGYDKKECEKLSDKIEDDDLKAKDYEDIIDQLDGLLSYAEKQIEEMDDAESKSDRCDMAEDYIDSDEFAYTLKFGAAVAIAKEKDELKGKAKEEFSDKEIKSRFKKVVKKIDKLVEKCEIKNFYKTVADAVGSQNLDEIDLTD